MRYEQPTLDIIKNLRDRKHLRLFDWSTKYYHHIQINKKDKGICWERWVSKDKRNWIQWNACLSLREVLDIRAEIAVKCQALCFNH